MCEIWGLNTFLPIPHCPGILPGTHPAIGILLSIRWINQHPACFPFLLSVHQNEQVKRKCLSQQISVWFSPSSGQFLQCINHFVSKYPDATQDPHFQMTPACQSLTQSKLNLMPSKGQFVNHFPCHTFTQITWQLHFRLSNAVGPS